MKKSTCKLLLWIGIIWFVLTLIGIIPSMSSIFGAYYGDIGKIFMMGILLLIIINIPSIILFIIAGAKWSSEEEGKDLKEAQLQALKKGGVTVNIKGKMKKLK